MLLLNCAYEVFFLPKRARVSEIFVYSREIPFHSKSEELPIKMLLVVLQNVEPMTRNCHSSLAGHPHMHLVQHGWYQLVKVFAESLQVHKLPYRTVVQNADVGLE